MICVEVVVNGKPACMADGYPTFLNLLVHSGQYAGNPNPLRVTGFLDGAADIAPRLRSALQKPMDEQHEWLSMEMQPGDEITIRIVDRPESSPTPASEL